jgi:hypothetical protein
VILKAFAQLGVNLSVGLVEEGEVGGMAAVIGPALDATIFRLSKNAPHRVSPKSTRYCFYPYTLRTNSCPIHTQHQALPAATQCNPLFPQCFLSLTISPQPSTALIKMNE